MAVRDGARFVGEAVDSILEQTFGDFELVAVDDGSTDATSAILGSYSDPRVRTVRREVARGQAASLNEGLRAARGALIARHDADDIAEPERLERQVAFLDRHHEIVAVGSAWTVIDEDGRGQEIRTPPADALAIRWRLLFSNAFLHSSMLLRRDVFDRVGMYDEEIEYGEDYALWSRVAAASPVANLRVPLVRYRLSPTSKTATVQPAQEQVDALSGSIIDGVAGRRDWPGFASSAAFAACARRLMLSSTPEVEPGEAVAAAAGVLVLHDFFVRFYDLRRRVAVSHRARVSAVLGSRLRDVGRNSGDAKASRMGRRLLAAAVVAEPPLLVRRVAL